MSTPFFVVGIKLKKKAKGKGLLYGPPVRDPVHKNAHHNGSSLYAVRNFVHKLFDNVFVTLF